MDNVSLIKNILRDPLGALAVNGLSNEAFKVQQLSKLNDQYVKLKNRHNDLQIEIRKASREIGEKKSKGEMYDSLLSVMRGYNKKNSEIVVQLKEVENKILSIFGYVKEKAITNNVQDNAATKYLSKGRGYRLEEVEDREISIFHLTDEHKEWNEYVDARPEASIYHKVEWLELITNTFGHQCIYLLAKDLRGKVVGVLPLIRLKSYLFGDFLVSMPYFNYGGPVGDHSVIEKKLTDTANVYGKKLGVKSIEYREDIPRAGYPVRTNKVSMILALPQNERELWQGFTSKLRAQIKRPQKEKSNVKVGGEELLEEFYEVFSRNMRDLGTPVYSKLFFKNIMTRFPDKCHILVIVLKNRPVAAGFLIGYKNTLEIPWASTVRDVNHLSMNMLLYWEVLRFAIRNKFSLFDFGRSSIDSGTFRFKRQWGAIPKQLYWHYWLPNGKEMPHLNHSNPKFKMIISIWKKLPVFLTKIIGPVIVKNLP